MLTHVFTAAYTGLLLLTPIVSFCIVVCIVLLCVYKSLGINNLYKGLAISLMFAIFGAAIGVFIGGAKESIVSTILPSLITLVTGYIAYLATKEMDEEIKKNIPGAMIMFLISLLFSSFYMKYLSIV